ncbi:unnamed protein product [Heligmosomoides polygyrus]|uniref:Uncharacterized protein n=1 Tax=Heligmosomoides polygyrus TaxID=6339 RepID=A0A183GNI5_HELPZ|nr:unnamed protein product [Heligmosomoides polygyrus]
MRLRTLVTTWLRAQVAWKPPRHPSGDGAGGGGVVCEMRIGGRAVRTAFAAAAFLTTKTLDEKVTGSKIETIRPQRNYADVPISKKSAELADRPMLHFGDASPTLRPVTDVADADVTTDVATDAWSTLATSS